MIPILLAAQLLAAAGGAMHRTPPALGAPHFVQLASLTGLPADSVARRDFLTGLRSEFASDQLPSEARTDAGEWEHGVPVSNRFRLLEGSPADDAWNLSITLGSPPPLRLPSKGEGSSRRATQTRRTSRGMIAAFEITPPPDDAGAGTRSVRDAFVFPAAGEDSTTSLGVPAIGYAFPWADAGRAVARLALEQLMRSSGDLRERERFDVAPALRQEAGR